MQAKRRLKNVTVLFISLVDKGANKRTIIWKSQNSAEPVFTREISIAKIDDEKQMVYGIVYAPEDVDSQGDVMTGAEVEKAAYGFMKARRIDQIDRQHDQQPDEGFVAESWLVRGGDPLFPLEKGGAWAVGIKVENPETWKLIKAGEIGGLSMGGFAQVEEIGKGEEQEQGQGQTIKREGIMESLKEIFIRFFRQGKGQEQVQKDFNAQLQQDMMKQAAWALHDAINQIMTDETVTDKKSALKESVNQFLSYIDNMGESTMKQEEVQEQVQGQEQKKEQGQLSLEQLAKALDEAVAQLKALQERLEKIEKAHPGQQSVKGRDEQPGEAKKYKGLRIV